MGFAVVLYKQPTLSTCSALIRWRALASIGQAVVASCPMAVEHVHACKLALAGAGIFEMNKVIVYRLIDFTIRNWAYAKR